MDFLCLFNFLTQTLCPKDKKGFSIVVNYKYFLMFDFEELKEMALNDFNVKISLKGITCYENDENNCEFLFKFE